MSKIMQVRCNGKGKHINEVDIDEITRPTLVIRGEPKTSLRERYVLPCKHCTEGDVIVTRAMIEQLRET